MSPALLSLSSIRRQRCIIWKRVLTIINSVAINNKNEAHLFHLLETLYLQM